jgi:midasin (ATPase involved in ribosome maturation)
MIWFKIKRLEKLLAHGELSDFIAFKYFLAHLLLLALLYNFPANSVDVPVWSLYVKLIVALAAISWEMGKTFEINQNGDGKDYLKRVISISLVASLKTIVAFFIFAAIIATATLTLQKWAIIYPISGMRFSL